MADDVQKAEEELKKGVDVNSKNSEGKTALHIGEFI